MLAVVPVVRPADELVVPQILVAQPLLQRLEVLAQRRSVQPALADHLLHGVLPRLLRAALHDAPQNLAGGRLPEDVAFVQRPVRIARPELVRLTAHGPVDLELQHGGDEVAGWHKWVMIYG